MISAHSSTVRPGCARTGRHLISGEPRASACRRNIVRDEERVILDPIRRRREDLRCRAHEFGRPHRRQAEADKGREVFSADAAGASLMAKAMHNGTMGSAPK